MSKRPVYRIDEVYVEHLKSLAINLKVEVSGVVEESGWTDPQLVLRPVKPEDKIKVFDFIAEPSHKSLQVITPISAVVNIPKNPFLNEIDVYSSINKVDVIFEDLVDDITMVSVIGNLTSEGVECQALRTLTDNLFTLVGDIHDCKVGDLVLASGVKARASFCMQGTTIELRSIRHIIL
jgi:hypothetical protein